MARIRSAPLPFPLLLPALPHRLLRLAWPSLSWSPCCGIIRAIPKLCLSKRHKMWWGEEGGWVILIVIVDGVDVAPCVAWQILHFSILSLSLSLFLTRCFALRHFLFFGHTGVTLRLTASTGLTWPHLPSLSRLACDCARCQPENVNLSHEHVRIFSLCASASAMTFFFLSSPPGGAR